MNDLWAQCECVEGQAYACAAAQLRLWLARNPQGWQVAARHEAESRFESLHETETVPDTADWQRFVTPSSSSCMCVRPALPDRPVMSRPEAHIEIAPRHKGLFFVTIPVWVRLELAAHAAHRAIALCEFPTRVLSKTWFGHPAEDGAIGYALTTRARQSLDELNDVAGRAICPVLVDNDTASPLIFSQLLLSVRHMGLYATDDGRLWTNECRMKYKGSVYPASLAFGHAAPEQAAGARLMAEPREAPTSGLTARTITDAIFRQPF